MRTVRTLSIILGLALPGVAGFSAPAITTPTLVDVRYATHPGFDRVVFDWTGGLPTWRAAYGTLVGEGTGTPIALTGRADLVLSFSNARAHTDDGRPTYRMTTVLDPNLPTLKQIKFGGDYEGYVSAGLGLRDFVSYKVSTLLSPPRVVVDVSHRSEFGYTTVSRTGTAANVVVDRIRTGRHAGFDRMVFDVRGTALPAFSVAYVPGSSTIAVRFVALGSATSSPHATYSGPSPIWVGYSALRSVRLYSVGGGVMTFRARNGVKHGFRVLVLRDPIRVVVDIRH